VKVDCIEKCLETILNQIDAPEEVTVFVQTLKKEDRKDLKVIGATKRIVRYGGLGRATVSRVDAR